MSWKLKVCSTCSSLDSFSGSASPGSSSAMSKNSLGITAFWMTILRQEGQVLELISHRARQCSWNTWPQGVAAMSVPLLTNKSEQMQHCTLMLKGHHLHGKFIHSSSVTLRLESDIINSKGGRERKRVGGRETLRHTHTLTETVTVWEKGENSNSKTLFYKDCSLDSVKSMSN